MSKSLPDLSGFTGSSEFYRHALVRNVIHTEGVQHLAESVGAYWLVDEIALANKFNRKVAAEPFQVWKLEVSACKAKLIAEDGNDHKVFAKRIPFTDFPEPGIKLFCCDGGDYKTVLLPSEY